MKKSWIVAALICAGIILFINNDNSSKVTDSSNNSFNLLGSKVVNNKEESKKVESKKENTKENSKKETKTETKKKETKTETKKEETVKNQVTTNSANIVLNKYYVDARESTPRLEKEYYEDELGSSHNSIPTPYLKFLNSEDVELNYACTGEDMCVTQTTYSTYKENGVTYIKLYEKLGGKHSVEELYFLCSGEGDGYALLKLNGNTISVIPKNNDFNGLDLTETTDYKLYN